MIPRNPMDSFPGVEHPWVQGILAIFLDAVGMFTYVFPVIGEFGDILWAPLSAAFIAGMAGWERFGPPMVVVGFVEEILPFTDFVPSCSIAWICKFWRH